MSARRPCIGCPATPDCAESECHAEMAILCMYQVAGCNVGAPNNICHSIGNAIISVARLAICLHSTDSLNILLVKEGKLEVVYSG